MIKYNLNNINDWNFGEDNIIKVYRNNAVCYYKFTSGDTPTPSFQGKWLATYSDSHTESAACDSTSAITENEITLTNLVSVEIGDCVTSIGNYAFTECINLTSIDIPNSVTSIGDGAFDTCESLTTCTIGSGVTYIGDDAFYGCTSLTSVTINATTPPTLGGGFAFLDTNDCPIYVPSDSVETYKAADEWSGLASRIQAIP